MPKPLVTAVLVMLASSPLAAAQGTPDIESTGTPFYVPFNDVLVTDGTGPTVMLNGNLFLDAPEIGICLGINPSAPTSCPGGAEFDLTLTAGSRSSSPRTRAGPSRPTCRSSRSTSRRSPFPGSPTSPARS